MNQSIIDSLIEKSGIRPGDSVWMNRKAMGLLDNHIIYLGRDESRHPWFVGRFEEGVRVLTQDQIAFLIKVTEKVRLNLFKGDGNLRANAVDRMLERLDSPTFLLILRNSSDHKKEIEVSNKGFKWENVVLGLGIGTGLLGTIGLAAAAWKFWNEMKEE